MSHMAQKIGNYETKTRRTTKWIRHTRIDTFADRATGSMDRL